MLSGAITSLQRALAQQPATVAGAGAGTFRGASRGPSRGGSRLGAPDAAGSGSGTNTAAYFPARVRRLNSTSKADGARRAATGVVSHPTPQPPSSSALKNISSISSSSSSPVPLFSSMLRSGQIEPNETMLSCWVAPKPPRVPKTKIKGRPSEYIDEPSLRARLGMSMQKGRMATTTATATIRTTKMKLIKNENKNKTKKSRRTASKKVAYTRHANFGGAVQRLYIKPRDGRKSISLATLRFGKSRRKRPLPRGATAATLRKKWGGATRDQQHARSRPIKNLELLPVSQSGVRFRKKLNDAATVPAEAKKQKEKKTRNMKQKTTPEEIMFRTRPAAPFCACPRTFSDRQCSPARSCLWWRRVPRP